MHFAKHSIQALITLSLMVIALLSVAALAAPGDLISNVPLPVPGFGVGVAVDCEGNIYYTNYPDADFTPRNNLYKMDKLGNLLATVAITDSGGSPIFIDEMAWDRGNNILWGVEHNSNPEDVYQIDPLTGTATFAFTSQTISIGTYRDGLAFDGTDGTIWISGDISTTIEHYQTDGTLINQITPKKADGSILGSISGVSVGVGDLLYLGQNGLATIVQVQKSNGDFIGNFASPGGARDEGLECDPINFAPLLALWSREFYSPGFVSVIEIESGTCACGGGPGETIVDVDIKPTSCPNPLNVKYPAGVLPVAILGTSILDIHDINPASVRLAGVAPLRWAIQDVAAPVTDRQSECQCTTAGPDGYLDRNFIFNKAQIIAALGPVNNGDIIPVTLTGMFNDSTNFEGSDCVWIIVIG